MPPTEKPSRLRACIQNGDVVLPDRVVRRGTVIIADGKIAHSGAARRTPRGATEIDARGGYITPGLIDVHVHGAGAHSLDPPSETSLRAIVETLASRGILQFVPTMMPCETLIDGLARLVETPEFRRRIPGIYIEGPFVNPDKRGGIQPQYVFPVDLARLRRIHKIGRGRIVMMTFAPELDGAEALPRAMRDLGILPCVGHTLTTCARAAEVVGRSKVGVTHLFNAMTGLDHRKPGAAAYCLNYDNAWVEVNPDGTHVHPELLKLIYRAKRHDRIVLMTDAVISAGDRPGEYEYMDRTVVANDAGVYYKREGTLVGSRILLNEGVARFMEYTGAPLEDAVRMASLNPATMLGIARRKGSLEVGKDADVVVFQRNFAKAKAAFFEGERLR